MQLQKYKLKILMFTYLNFEMLKFLSINIFRRIEENNN